MRAAPLTLDMLMHFPSNAPAEDRAMVGLLSAILLGMRQASCPLQADEDHGNRLLRLSASFRIASMSTFRPQRVLLISLRFLRHHRATPHGIVGAYLERSISITFWADSAPMMSPGGEGWPPFVNKLKTMEMMISICTITYRRDASKYHVASHVVGAG